ncbi:methyltransferase domain-containing protein [Streptomyces mauvecolor]
MALGQDDMAVLANRLLTDIAKQLGRPLAAPYEAALRATPRHLFLPDRLWLRDGAGGYRPCDKNTHPDGWWTAAYTDTPLVTQFTDGAPSSSASMPSMVLRSLLLAATEGPEPGAVLELGTGTGFNAALLCALYGQDRVTTLELDETLAAQATTRLKAAGYAPHVAVADASTDLPGNGMYDMLVATFSVDRVPAHWLRRCRPGGRIVTPWFSDWCAYGTAALDVTPDHRAEGRFHPFGSYMTMRTQAAASSCNSPVHHGGSLSGAQSMTGLSPWAVAGGDLDAEFHLGLAVPGVSYEWDSSGEHAPTRLWLYGADGSSVATIDHDGVQAEQFTVTQQGPRHLWGETSAAYARWSQLGRPTVDRHGLTLSPDGTQRVWIDSPESVLATEGDHDLNAAAAGLELKEALALAKYRERQRSGTASTGIPHAEARTRLGLDHD